MSERLYSPQLSAQVVRALYREARMRQMPITRLANTLLSEKLRDRPSWLKATSTSKSQPILP